MAEETAQEKLTRLRKQHDIGMSKTEKARLTAQGVALGFGDEIEASIRAMSPNVTYEEAINEIRNSISGAKEKFPSQALAYEVGGAFLPGLAAAPFTAGASLLPSVGRATALTTTRVAPSLLRTAGVGFGEGAVYAVGSGDGEATGSDIIKDATIGSIANPAAQKAFQLAAVTLKSLVRPFFKGKRAKAVENEIMRIVESTGEPVESIIDRVRNGEIIADMSDVVATELRAIYAKGGKGAQAINDRLRDRSGRLRDETIENIQSDLAPIAPEGNVQMAISRKTKDLEKAESNAYQEIFDNSLPMGSNSVSAVSSTIRDALQDFPQLRSMVNGILKAKRLPPVFSVKEKQVELIRQLDLETVEVIRRALKDRVSKSFNSGDGTLGSALDTREKELRKFIDEYSPDLAATRAKWSAIQSAKDGFDKGNKIFNKSADDAEEYFEEISSNPEVLEAFRAGVASAIRKKSGQGARQGLIMKLDDIRSGERAILEKIYPGETLDAIVEKINNSRQAFTSESKILQGSQTTFTDEAITRQGASGAAGDIIDIMTAGVVGKTKAAIRLVKRGMGKQADLLSEDELEQVSQMLIEENADVIEAALRGRISSEALAERLSIWTNRIASGIGSASTVGAIQSDVGLNNFIPSANAEETGNIEEVDSSLSPALQSLIKTTDPSLLNRIN